ncbi:MAG: hypothetical protein AAB846_00810, partial [Patescibacteria group bacterium]
ILFIATLLTTLFTARVSLFISPLSNLNLGSYNIHHLFPSAFLLVITVIFLIIGIRNKPVIMLAGVASALVVDEIIYLIATDGSDLAYLTPVSFWGAVTLTLVVLLTAVTCYRMATVTKKV